MEIESVSREKEGSYTCITYFTTSHNITMSCMVVIIAMKTFQLHLIKTEYFFTAILMAKEKEMETLSSQLTGTLAIIIMYPYFTV